MTVRGSSSIAFVASLVLSGCPQDIVPQGLDGSAGDTSIDGGEPSDAAVGDGGRDAGGLDGASDAGNDDGGIADGGLADGGVDVLTPLRFGVVSGAGLPSNLGSLGAIWGRSEDEIYIGTSRGRVYGSAGSTWSLITQSDDNNGIGAMSGTADKLYFGTSANLYVFDGAALSRYLIPMGRQVHAIWAVSDTEVYVSVDQTNGREIFRFDGVSLNPEYTPALASVYALWSDLDDTLYLGGTLTGIIERSSNIYTAAQVELPQDWDPGREIDMSFYGFGRIDQQLFAVGSDSTIFRRDSDQIWRIERDNGGAAGGELRWVGGWTTPKGPEGYAAGYGSSEGPLLRYYDGSWTAVAQNERWSLTAGWSPNPDRYYFVGFPTGSVEGVVVVGTRP